LTFEQVHQGRGQDVHPEEAEVVGRSQARDDQTLFGQGGSRFFEDLGDLVQGVSSCHPTAADGSEVGKFALVRRLDGGDGGAFVDGGFHQLTGATDGRGADIDVVSDQQEEGFFLGEGSTAGHRMAVASGFGLFDEAKSAPMGSGGLGVGGLVARVDDDGDFFDAGRERLFNHHA
jgi:hypothetical protein